MTKNAVIAGFGFMLNKSIIDVIRKRKMVLDFARYIKQIEITAL
tara:strand:+ start:27 stop:158 length:132 start_codon:yes stop_codon:yes gene_type:complete